jgi:hypothetical protein
VGAQGRGQGPPFCKHVEGEMMLEGNSAAPEIWKFSTDDASDTSAVMIGLKRAEKVNSLVTLDYRQDLGALFRCSDIEYFVTKVEN